VVVSQKLIARYAELKGEVPGCLLLMQVGTFLQVMGDDARAVAAVTGLKLQSGGDADAPVVLGGFPKSGLDAYVGKLVRSGRSVAIALQDETKERRISEVVRLARTAPADAADSADSAATTAGAGTQEIPDGAV